MEAKDNEKLKAASSNLAIYLIYTVRVINWHSWEKLKVKDEEKREKVTANFDMMENKVRDNFPTADKIINNSFHVFAAKSDLYSIESIAPPRNPFFFIEEFDEIIGTSAHHACVCFIRRCIQANFWKDDEPVQKRWKSELLPKLNQNQLMLRMYWERMRVFETSNFEVNHDYENMPSTAQMIEEETNKSNPIKPGFHSRTEEIPSVFCNSNGEPFPSLKGNQTQLAHALGLSEHKFKSQAEGNSIWVIQHTPQDLELLVHKMDQNRVADYRKRLDSYEPTPRKATKKKPVRKRKPKKS